MEYIWTLLGCRSHILDPLILLHSQHGLQWNISGHYIRLLISHPRPTELVTQSARFAREYIWTQQGCQAHS